MARPTWYNGVLMRSRLEAAFAQSLEGLATWEYEPCCYADATGQYLPDFRVAFSEVDIIYVEVKPDLGSALAVLPSMERIFATEPDAHLTVYVPEPGWPIPRFWMPAHRWGHTGTWRYHKNVA